MEEPWKKDIEQLRIQVGDLISKVESLEKRISELEDEKDAAPKGPEPILTCVQCNAEYKESENAEGYCKYHTGTLNYSFKTKVTCCGKSASSVSDLMLTPGCTKGKHQSKHHTKFFYTNYLVFMNSLCNEAKETWLEMDIYDYVKESCLWAEVGISSQDEVFVVGGPQYAPEVCTSLKTQELKKCKQSSQVLFEKSDSAGWCLKAELVASSGSTAEGLIITLKTSWSKTPYCKKISFAFEEDKVRPKSFECLSDPRPEKPSTEYTVPEESKTGFMLEAGEDYSQGRKNDYPTETNDDMFAIEMKQIGQTEVDSNTWGVVDNKWKNLFSTHIKISNNSLEIIPVADVVGEYKNAEGEWVKCDNVYVKLKESREFLEMNDFMLDGAAPMTIFVRLAVVIQDANVPNDNQERERAHHSFPQPLLLRVTLVDNQNRTASLIFEQGNKPLSLATKEGRQANWAKKRPLLFHLFADDVNLRKRSDVTFYHDEDLKIIYRPAVNGSGSTYYYLNPNVLNKLAYKAKKADQKEQEVEEFKTEGRDSTIRVFAVVDLDYQFTFALKVVITTPTSSATGHFLLPRVDYSKATITVSPAEVEIKGDLTIEWDLPQVSKNDRIEIFNRYGTKSLSYTRLKDSTTSATIKAPASPGEYEARCYPKCLSRIGMRHDAHVAMAVFTVIPA